jgi:hypothetical protein
MFFLGQERAQNQGFPEKGKPPKDDRISLGVGLRTPTSPLLT